ncbi:hypothetical protein CROQUDRAFT_130996 [Cronartium quercuum f. sp. fusiforme G11]|uniref:Uncharacterized protein n=1 Tax=Cronartium quercuum f. sp. fusiforme G11 TaxID=708437 RepID=A0A9P6TFI7_9BASI|nr:hypothetical protein CROQUDRAFT_130996 [Cronartium quercuum f. sp. fusiforme G11]
MNTRRGISSDFQTSFKSFRPGTIPRPNEYDWTNLPGWVTSYLRTQLHPTPTNNSEAFESLLNIMQIPKFFWKGVGGQTVWVITTHTYISTTSLGKLEIDLEDVICFISRNAQAKEVRKGEITDLDQLQLQISDWIVFPAQTLKQLQDQSRSREDLRGSFEKLRRPEERFCRVAVIGSWDLDRNLISKSTIMSGSKGVRVENMRLAELWQQGFLVTYTSEAAMDQPDQLEEWLKRLERRDFDANDPELEPRTAFIPWMDLITFHSLNPNSLSNSKLPVQGDEWKTFLARIQVVELISRYKAWPQALINSLSGSKTSIKTMCQHLSQNYFPNPMTFQETLEASKNWDQDEVKHVLGDELKVILKESKSLGHRFWNLRSTLVIVSHQQRVIEQSRELSPSLMDREDYQIDG